MGNTLLFLDSSFLGVFFLTLDWFVSKEAAGWRDSLVVKSAVAIPKDLGSVCSIHITQVTMAFNCSCWDPVPSSGSKGTKLVCTNHTKLYVCVCLYVCMYIYTFICIYNFKKSSKEMYAVRICMYSCLCVGDIYCGRK